MQLGGYTQDDPAEAVHALAIAVHAHAIVVNADAKQLRGRRERALNAVHLRRTSCAPGVDHGTATPDEREAWEGVDVVGFLLAAAE